MTTRKIRCIVCEKPAEVEGMRKICDPCRKQVDPTGCMSRPRGGGYYVAHDNPWGRVDYGRDGSRRVGPKIRPE